MKKLLPFIMLVALISSTMGANSQLSWMPLEPNVVKLEGELLKVRKYGPPNYGSNPESDVLYYIPILLLSRPIGVKGDPMSNVTKEDLFNVSFVQLIFHNTPTAEYWRYANRNVAVTGSLFRAQTGHHYTPLVMDVRSISLSSYSSTPRVPK